MHYALQRKSTIEKIADALLPGDDVFPSGSAAGVHFKLQERGLTSLGHDILPTVIAGADKALQDGTDLETALAAFEKARPVDFGALINIAYLAYYENLDVKQAIRSLGYAYNDQPQPKGFSLSPFDPANPLERPKHGRGRYLRTEEVRPVDHAHLGNLTERVG